MSLVIDWDSCLALANNNEELAKDLLRMLAEDLPPTIQELQKAQNEHNFDQLLHYSHRLHGAACYCGVPALKQAAKDLEQHLKSTSEPDNNVVGPLLEALFNAIKDVQDAYTEQFTAKQ